MSGEVEKYLIAFNQANELHAKLNDTADMIEEVADALRGEPDEALAGIPSDWPAAEDLRNVVRDFETASEQVHNLWDLVRRDLRVHLPQPDQIGRVATDIPDDDD
jgi:phytoene/squalene synthetase